VPASRIPAYKSPTKQPKGLPRQQQPQQQQSSQQQQLLQLKAHSRIPQPQVTRKSLPDTEQQGSSPDQTDRAASTALAPATGTTATSTDSRTANPAVRTAVLQRGPPPAPAAAVAAAVGPRGTGLVAAAAAAFEGSRAGSASSGGLKAAAPAALEPFVPLDLDANDGQLVEPSQQPLQQQEVLAGRPQERLSRSSSGSAQSRGSGGRVPRSLLQLEPSRWVRCRSSVSRSAAALAFSTGKSPSELCAYLVPVSYG